MGFFKFCWRYPIQAAVFAIGFVMSAVGLIQQGAEIWQGGVAAWKLQLAGLVLVVVSIAWMLYKFEKDRAVPAPAAPMPDDGDNEKAVWMRIYRAMHGAQRAVATGRRLATMTDAAPRLYAALLTVHKDYDLRLPKVVHTQDYDIKIGADFLEAVMPLIREGHLDEARQRAVEFSARYDEIFKA